MLGNMDMIKLMLEYKHQSLCCCGPSFFDDSDYGVDIDKKLGGAYEGNAVIYTAPSCDVEVHFSFLALKNITVTKPTSNFAFAKYDKKWINFEVVPKRSE